MDDKFDTYMRQGLPGLARDARKTVASDPTATARKTIALANRGALENQVRYLERRLSLIEEAVSKVLNLDPEHFRALLDQELATPEPRKTVDELALETVPCPRCARPVHRKLPRCQVCGTAITPPTSA